MPTSETTRSRVTMLGLFNHGKTGGGHATCERILSHECICVDVFLVNVQVEEIASLADVEVSIRVTP